MIFYINENTHEVHKHICKHVLNSNIVTLGNYDYPYLAVAAAIEKGYKNADGCAHCCPQSHTK